MDASLNYSKTGREQNVINKLHFSVIMKEALFARHEKGVGSPTAS